MSNERKGCYNCPLPATTWFPFREGHGFRVPACNECKDLHDRWVATNKRDPALAQALIARQTTP